MNNELVDFFKEYEDSLGELNENEKNSYFNFFQYKNEYHACLYYNGFNYYMFMSKDFSRNYLSPLIIHNEKGDEIPINEITLFILPELPVNKKKELLIKMFFKKFVDSRKQEQPENIKFTLTRGLIL